MDLGMAAKVRPCLVISTGGEDTDRAFVTLVPHTTSTRGSRFEAIVNVPFLKAGAFDAQGLVTIPVRHAIRQLGSLTPDRMRVVEEAICRWLELSCERGAR